MPSLHCHKMTLDRKHNVVVVSGGCDGNTSAADTTILLKRNPTANLVRALNVSSAHPFMTDSFHSQLLTKCVCTHTCTFEVVKH